MLKKTGLTAASLLCAQLAFGSDMDLRATTEFGRAVLLKGDGTWHYVSDARTGEKQKPRQPQLKKLGQQALLTVEKWTPYPPKGCRLGMRLENRLSSPIRTMVLRFTAFKTQAIPFETVSRGFTFVKPTETQYREVSFRGIDCSEVNRVQVSGARNCHVGELTKYSAGADKCLSLVQVAPSGLLNIAKPEPDLNDAIK